MLAKICPQLSLLAPENVVGAAVKHNDTATQRVYGVSAVHLTGS